MCRAPTRTHCDEAGMCATASSGGGSKQMGERHDWVDELVCARKPKMDVLVEYGLSQDEENVSQNILALPFM